MATNIVHTSLNCHVNIAEAFLRYEDLGAESLRLKNILRDKDDYGLTVNLADDIAREVNAISTERNNIFRLALACKNAFNSMSEAAVDSRGAACSSDAFLPDKQYVSKFTNLAAKPYYLRYFTTNELIPGEEVINFNVKGNKIKNIKIVKKLNETGGSYEDINSVEIHPAADGSRSAGTSITMSAIPDADLPVGLRLEMDSGRVYFEKFAFTRASIPQPSLFGFSTRRKVANEPVATKDDFRRSNEAGDLLPPAWKEK